MNVLELAAQGVRGFSSAVRVPLRAGVNVVTPPGEAAVPLGQVVAALLFADGRGEDAALASPQQKAKAAVSFVGRDGTTYRLLRELGGGGGLQRLIAGKPEVVSQNASEIAQHLRAQLGLPSKKVFEALCLVRAEQRAPRGPARKAPAPPASSLAASHHVEPASDVGAAKAKLQALEAELQISREVENLQFEQDGLASQLFELESRLQKVSLLRSSIGDAERALQMAPTIESLKLPADVHERIERYPQAISRRDEALARLDEERVQAQEEAEVSTEPLSRDPRFWAAMALGIACFVAAFFLEGAARYVALLNLPAFGAAAALALRYVDDLQRAERAQRKGERTSARIKKIEEDYVAEVSVIQRALRELALERPEEIVELLARRPQAEERLRALQDELAQLQAQPDYAEAAREQAQLKAKQERINAALLEKGGGYIRDLRDVERELERTQESIALALQADGQVEAGGAEGDELADPGPRLLAAAAELQQSDIAQVAAHLGERCAQYVAALTERRYTQLTFSPSGDSTAHTVKGEAIAFAQLPPTDAAWVCLALRLTLAERVLAPAKLPLFVDEGFSGYDEARFGLVARMVKHLGTLMQVIVVTRQPALLSVADHTAAA